MIIKYLEPTDNIEDYLECVKDLNHPEVPVTTADEIKSILDARPSNILTFVGVVGDRVVATATIIMEKKLRYKSLCCYIEDVAVHPDFRNKGYGKKIVEYCVDVAQQNRCYKIKLNCSDKLLGFYIKIGFEKMANHMIMGPS